MYVYWLGPPPLEENIGATIVDRNGEIIYDDDLDIIPLEEMPDYLIDAFILTEDKHFYHHFGFDLRGIARALIRNIEAKQLKEGASTITQQLARNLYLTHEKTWMRKLKESFYTVRLEMFYPKDTILTMYLNTIYFGHGAYGIGDASDLFFGKDVNELSVAEATMLAG
ncbi:MAG: transglycosylase domain-containing protein, partial [Bacillales bacterium]